MYFSQKDLSTQQQNPELMEMGIRHGYSLLVLWILVITCFVLFLVQHFQLSSLKKMLYAKQFPKYSASQSIFNNVSQNFRTTIPETVAKHRLTSVEDDQPLPGPYNLLEDAYMHSNALVRPTKECTLGKVKFVQGGSSLPLK